MSDCQAKQLINRRVSITKSCFAELVLWSIPNPVLPSEHLYKYRLVLISQGHCVIRYDNERGKGDHKHLNNVEMPYIFSTVETLVTDFFNDVMRWNNEHSNN